MLGSGPIGGITGRVGTTEVGPFGIFCNELGGILGGNETGLFLTWLVGFGLPGIDDGSVFHGSILVDGEGVADFSIQVEHFTGDGVAFDGDEAGSVIEDDAAHERVCAGAAVGGAAVAGGHGNGAIVGIEALALLVGALAIRVAVAVVENDAFGD